MASGYDYFYTLQEICVLLNLLPHTFRQIAREYSDLVVPREQVRKGRPVMGLPRADFEVLRQIVEMRSRGVAPEEIRRTIGAGSAGVASRPAGEAGDPFEKEREDQAAVDGAADNVAGAPEADRLADSEVHLAAEAPLAAAVEPVGIVRAGRTSEEALLAEMAALRSEMQKLSEQRREERDRLLTALMRTQHELQSLRYEVGVSLSRRDRKRKRGFWAWLFDL